MADLALVFHWTPRDMDPMTPEELARWWLKAKVRHEETDG
jgi:hypothetical protein